MRWLAVAVRAARTARALVTLGFHWLSRDAFLLVNNLVLLVMMVTVLLGTLYPLVLDSLGLGKISVGPPYFNALFVPLTTLLCAFMGLGPASRWKQMPGRELARRLALSGGAALIIGSLLPLLLDIEWSLSSVALGLVIALSGWCCRCCATCGTRCAPEGGRALGGSQAPHAQLLGHAAGASRPRR